VKKILILFLVFSNSVFAEFQYLARSPQAQLMGGAFTALADDEYAIFYNPASLARTQNAKLSILNPSFQVPNVTKMNFSFDKISFDIDNKFSNFPSTTEGVLSQFMNYPISMKMTLMPNIKLGNLAFSFFVSSSMKMLISNPYLPTLKLNYRVDQGFIMGYAFDLIGKSQAKHQLSMGFSGKQITREGVDGSLEFLSPEILKVTSGGSLQTILNAFGKAKGSAFGFDTGIEYNFRPNKWSRLGFATSYLDVADTTFKKESGPGVVPAQESSLNFGLAWEQKYTMFNYAVTTDYGNYLDPFTPSGSKLQFGIRAQFASVVDLYFGLNGGYNSFGVGFDAFIFKFLIGFYGVEIGSSFKQLQAKRLVFTVNLLNIDLDI